MANNPALAPDNGPPVVPLGAASLRFTIPLQAPANALDDDELETANDNPAISSLVFLPWGQPSAAGTVRIHRALFQSALLPGCRTDPTSPADKAALGSANILEQELSAAKTSELSFAWYQAGLFNSPILSVGQLGELMVNLTSRLPDPTVLFIRDADLEDAEPFDAVLGAPAAPRGSRNRGRRGRGAAVQPAAQQPILRPGPPSLQPLLSVTWLSLLNEFSPGSHLEGRTLAFLYGYLGSKTRSSTRDDSGSDVRTGMECLVGYLTAWARAPALGPEALAKKIPGFITSTTLSIPLALRGTGGTVASYSRDMQDAVTLVSGRGTESDSVLSRRIYENLSSFTALSCFRPLLSAWGQMASSFEQLSSKLVGARRISHYGAAVELDTYLCARLPLLQQLVSSDGATIESVVRALLNLHETQTASTSGGSGGGDAADSAVAPAVAGGGLLNAQIQVALSSSAFLQAVDAVGEAAGIDRLDVAFSARCILLTRYLVDAPGWLKLKHPLFDDLSSSLDDRQAYFSRVVALDLATGQVPESVASWRWDRTTCDSLFLKGLWHEIDWVNAPSGYLDYDSVAKVATYHPVGADELYISQQTLLGVQRFGSRLFTALGFPRHCQHGYSFEAFIDHHMELTQYITNMPVELREGWDGWASAQFKSAMKRAGRYFLDTIRSGTPADACLDGWLPSDSDYFQITSARMTSAKPILDVRRAFGSFFTTAPLVVPGTTPPTAPSHFGTSAHARLGGKGTSGSPPGGGNSKGGDKRKLQATALTDTPGAKASYSKVLDNGKSLFLAGRVYDLESIAKKFNVKRADYCWPVLLSTKPGAQALALCPDHANHGGIKSSFHKCPPQFNRATASSAPYAKPATAAQCKEAGWGPDKRVKP